MPSSPSRHTSTTLNVKPPRMLVPSLASTSSVSSTSPPPPPSRMVLTRRETRRTSLSSTWEVEHSMFPSLPSRTVSSRSRRPPGTHTWVVRTSTTEWLITSSKTSSAVTRRTCLRTTVPSVVSVPPVNVPSVRCRRPRRHTSRSTRCTTVSTSTPPSRVPVSRTCVWTTSRSAWTLSKRSCVMPRSPRTKSTRSCSSVVPPVSPRSSRCLPTSSTARSRASPSTPMRLSPTEPLFRPLSCLVLTSLRSSPSCCSSTSRLCRSVLKLPVVS
mmetsp:Transcript_25997/g.61697  ORF Transcript_25997/g.61697 Transcript_25997/m.61697 type:complete len:270 (-) Transcript_25997:1016-1825(-)